MDNERSDAIFSLAKKEFMDNVRNKWVIILSVIFVGLILLISAYGGVRSREEEGFQGFEFTLNIGSSIVTLLISIVAILIAYNTLAQEVESHSLGLLLTSKMGRKDIVVGKFIGLSSVLCLSIIVGLGIGGMVIGISTGFEDFGIYLAFILISILFGMAYISISILMSSVVDKRSKALAGGIFIWIFFNIIWDLVLLGVLLASGWQFPTETIEVTYPGWYRFAGLINPNGAYSSGIALLTDSMDFPELLTVPLTAIALLVWIIVPIILSILIFENRDL